MKDWRNWAIPLLVLLIGFGFYYFLTREDGYKDFLEKEVQKQDLIIKAAEKTNDSLMRAIEKSELRIVRLQEAIDSTAKQVEDAKREIERQRREFKALPATVRDSLIRAFIRQHQGAATGMR